MEANYMSVLNNSVQRLNSPSLQMCYNPSEILEINIKSLLKELQIAKEEIIRTNLVTEFYIEELICEKDGINSDINVIVRKFPVKSGDLKYFVCLSLSGRCEIPYEHTIETLCRNFKVFQHYFYETSKVYWVFSGNPWEMRTDKNKPRSFYKENSVLLSVKTFSDKNFTHNLWTNESIVTVYEEFYLDY